MPRPKTTYTSQFPDQVLDPAPLIKQERTGQESPVLNDARLQNAQTIEIAAIQANIGANPITGWKVGDDTINDRITRLGGTGSCWDEGEICDYTSIDPSGYILQNTGILISYWINPTGPPFEPPTPPIPAPLGDPVPWPGPGGPAPGPNRPVGPGEPYPAPDVPWDPASPGLYGPWVPPTDSDSDGRLDWNSKDFLQWLLWKVDTSMLMYSWQSGESINIQPRRYSELPEAITRIIGFAENWPTTRVSPATANKASIFDLLLPMSGLLNFVLNILGIGVAVGSIAGSEITFTASGNIDGAAAGAVAAEVAAALVNNSHASYNTANITDVAGAPAGPTIVATGLNGPADYRVIFSGALNQPTITQALVFYRTRLIHV